MRSISRWLAPPCSRVRIVTRKFGFKTFNSPLPLAKRGQRNVRRKWTLDVDRRRAVQLRGGGVSGGHEWRSLGGRRGTGTSRNGICVARFDFEASDGLSVVVDASMKSSIAWDGTKRR